MTPSKEVLRARVGAQVSRLGPPVVTCIQVVELYGFCHCLYYTHQVDLCSAHESKGHTVQTREVLVEYICSSHSSSSSSVYQADPLRARHKGDTVAYFSTGEKWSGQSWPSLPPFEELYRIRNAETYFSVPPDQGDLHKQRASQTAIDARWQSRTYPGLESLNSAPFKSGSLPQRDEYAKHIAPTGLELELVQSTFESFPSIEDTQHDMKEQVCASTSLPKPRLNPNKGLTAVSATIPCHDHQSHNIDSCQRECSWNVEEAAERGHTVRT